VLDVATGSGNAAIAAARRGCEVVGIDYVPALLERGRIRAAAEHLDVRFVEGDAEDLGFPDASVDAMVSIHGGYDRNGGTGPIAITGDYPETVFARM
jgi:ubiquinone/menaquinone biosynthesis C-methylase UbiE